MGTMGNVSRVDRLIMAAKATWTGGDHGGEGESMSRRRGKAHAVSVISGLVIIPAGLAGVLLAGPASAAPAAANPCAAKLTAVSASTTSPAASQTQTA